MLGFFLIRVNLVSRFCLFYFYFYYDIINELEINPPQYFPSPLYYIISSFLYYSIFTKEKLKKTKDNSKAKSLTSFLQCVDDQAKELGYSLDAKSKTVKERAKCTVTKSFNKVGLVVPLDKSGVGYRELNHTDSKWLHVMIMMYTQHELSHEFAFHVEEILHQGRVQSLKTAIRWRI